MEDSKIIDLFFERSEKAIEELSSKYGKLCHKVAINILGNFEDSEECVNDTYLGVWNSIPPNRPESLISYICKITRNLSLKRYNYNTASKRNSSYTTSFEELEECLQGTKDVESEIESKLLTEDIENFLGSLKKDDRIIFMQRYYFSSSYDDIASSVGISQKNVSVKLTRLRKQLRKHLSERGYII